MTWGSTRSGATAKGGEHERRLMMRGFVRGPRTLFRGRCRSRALRLLCVRCGRDCHALWLRLKPLSAARRRAVLLEAFAHPDGNGQCLLTATRVNGIVARCQQGALCIYTEARTHP